MESTRAPGRAPVPASGPNRYDGKLTNHFPSGRLNSFRRPWSAAHCAHGWRRRASSDDFGHPSLVREARYPVRMSDEAGLAGGESTYWIEDDGSGVCPHCGVPVQYADYTWHYHPKGSVHPPPFVKKGLTQHDQRIDVATCTKCGKHVADWVSYRQAGIEGGGGRNTLPMPVYEVVQRVGAYPGSRAPKVEPEVPPDLARDYREAVGVAHISTRAAAALARRGLQAALRGADSRRHRGRSTTKSGWRWRTAALRRCSRRSCGSSRASGTTPFTRTSQPMGTSSRSRRKTSPSSSPRSTSSSMGSSSSRLATPPS